MCSIMPSGAAGVLPNGWTLTPAGRSVGLAGDMPAAMLLSPDGKNLIISTAGFHDHSVCVLNLKSGKVTQSVDVGKNWFGMAIDPATQDVLIPDGGVAGKDFLSSLKQAPASLAPDQIHRFAYANGRLTPAAGLIIAGVPDSDRWTSGIACGTNGDAYVVNTMNDTVYMLRHGAVAVSANVGYRPLACSLSPDGKTLAVSNWGDKSVSLLDAVNLKEIVRIPVGSHPCALAWTTSHGSTARLFVANSGSNSVSVISASSAAWKVTESINTALTVDALVGSTPLALAVSHDNNRLFVANADNNDITVVDISNALESRVLGFIPTGWYPSTVAVSLDDHTLYVGVGKGLFSRANWPPLTNDGQTQPDGSGHSDYIGDCLTGAVSIITMPDAAALAHYSRQVVADVPHPALVAEDSRPALEALAKIKHVVYIIRENRTYDQVFGDIKSGNGDPSLVLFGQNVTPNAHKLAEETVLFDNLYVNGEVSQDGHQWCNAAYATDFTEKAWENGYSGRGQPDADDRLTESPGGYLWDNCASHGLTYRSYGEFAAFKATPNSPPVFNGEESLRGHASEAWSAVPLFDGARDQGKAQVFIDELHAAEKSGKWPNFMVMSLAEDHTKGLQAGAYSPIADVADNDQALGKIVEAVSASTFWRSTAIFVIEDDAQDGPDHVDCHRTVGLVISPYDKRGFVDHTHYTTASFVRTMEMILKLPAMSQYDQHATPVLNAFSDKPVMEAYSNLPAQVDLEAKNPAVGPGAVASARLDFSDLDRADPQTLNHILWDSIRPGTPMPAPVRSAWSGPAATVVSYTGLARTH